MGEEILKALCLMKTKVVSNWRSNLYLVWCSFSFTLPSLLSRVMNTGSQFVMEGVKNLVLKQQVSTLVGKHTGNF
jgi:hypothetical protein